MAIDVAIPISAKRCAVALVLPVAVLLAASLGASFLSLLSFHVAGR